MVRTKVDLEFSEGTVFGARYLTVHPEFSSDWTDFDVFQQTWHNMELWCADQFGPTSVDGVWTPDMRWYVNNRKFWFRSAEDLSWFVLRWS